jgi:Asp-tRNA(Asn)/Glu-tRNA(Gln) amidotransferase A subunit family amidase
VLSLCERSFGIFEQLGMEVVPHGGLPRSTSFAGNADLWPLWLVYRHWLMGASLRPLYTNPKFRAALKPEAIYELEGLTGGADGGPALTALERLQRLDQAHLDVPGFRKLFDTYAFAVLPTAQVFAFDATLDWPKSINGVRMPTYHRWMEVTAIGTLLGCPVINLPVGSTNQGLPMGIQVIAPNHQDLSLLQLADAWEQCTRWCTGPPTGVTRNAWIHWVAGSVASGNLGGHGLHLIGVRSRRRDDGRSTVVGELPDRLGDVRQARCVISWGLPEIDRGYQRAAQLLG